MVRKGFTIIELLIVIAVIAILVGIALPRFKGMRDEGNIARAKGELRTLQTAVESFRVHTGAYPATNSLADVTNATPQILATLPTDPFNGTNDYGYVCNSEYYVIYSVGPAGNGAATVTNTGAVNETTNGASCIYVSNGTSADTTP